MEICDIYHDKKIVFSCEVFPPKPGAEKDSILETIRDLKSLSPDFISVTYGAGGETKEETIEIADEIKNTYKMEPLMHLTCVDTKKEDIDKILNKISQKGIENILSLRGDIPTGRNFKSTASDFSYACDLAAHIKSHSDNFCLGVAGYPEGHPEAYSLEKDIKNLARKIQSGASFLITQMFFKNDFFYTYLDKIREMGINVPVSAGIMPVFKAKLLSRMIKLSRATVPSELISIVEKYRDNDEEMEKAGVEFAAKQIQDLIKHGIEGIHLFTMNRASIAKNISSYAGLR
ncbi:methylenetetrahydrofolate reductase [NAD(P)H] [candidate division WOR-3 bacterium]|nr:methylenetetrahydrofolate reductase [NAD(P)H] [candidate division WOR-3 bacterium]